ncbi:MAG: pyruvate dehydrogenase complex E1 component subunit beta [bacterium]|nr:pyruvate dehydrogenase complex E1 component subunit beta [bacterium]
MAIEILMPALSPTMEEGKLARWLVKEGDEIAAGQIIAEIETDKATMEIEAIEDGFLAKVLVSEGAAGVKVNTPIAIVLEEGEELDRKVAPASEPVAEPAAPEPFITPVEAPIPAPVVVPSVVSAAEGSKMSSDTSMVELTVREALRDAMAEEMRRDDDVFVMGEEVAEYQGAYKITQGLLAEFGEKRVIDTPITEHGFAGIAVGAAFAGLKPVVEFMTWNFAMQAIDHIINSAAKTLYMSGGQMSSSIVFRGPNGAASRVGAQHSQDYSSWYAQVPGLKVVAPYTAADAKGLLKAAIRDPNPIIFLEHEMVYGQTFEIPDVDDLIMPIGKAAIVREGTDVTLVSFSRGMQLANEAAIVLAEQGIRAEVIDLRTLRPLDMDTVLASVRKTNRIVTVEEAWPVASIGSEICSRVVAEAFDDLDAPPTKVNCKDVPMPYAANLEKLALPSVDDVVSAVKSVCYSDLA